MVKITEVGEVEAGRYWETPERGRRQEGGIAKGNPWGEGEGGRTAGVAAPRAPRRALSTSLSLSLPQCQCPASRACTPSYAATGVGGHDGRPPAGSGPRCSTRPRQPADFPSCQPATPSSRLSQDPPECHKTTGPRGSGAVWSSPSTLQRQDQGPERKDCLSKVTEQGSGKAR